MIVLTDFFDPEKNDQLICVKKGGVKINGTFYDLVLGKTNQYIHQLGHYAIPLIFSAKKPVDDAVDHYLKTGEPRILVVAGKSTEEIYLLDHNETPNKLDIKSNCLFLADSKDLQKKGPQQKQLGQVLQSMLTSYLSSTGQYLAHNLKNIHS
tara:strand:+ start:133 stop:588 length:456 start_codon:yes stop_codon:yes gene_type:complete